jgi:hypothetical protein
MPVTAIAGVLRFKVCPFGGDEITKFGGVLSMFRVTLAVAVLPALSATVPEIT